MAEKLFVSGISEILKKLSSIAGHEIDLVWGYKSELKKLRDSLDTIQAYSQDAEKRQVVDQVVRQWLKRLKRVAYDAEDILDEVECETLREEIEIQSDKMKKVIDCCSLYNSIAFRWKAARRIQDVNDTLNGLTTEMQAFNLNKGEGSKNASSETTSAAVNWREAFSLIDNSQVFGRENDVKKIKEMLLGNGLNISHQADDGETFTVISIVGFGGIGKTTLAQILCNDEEVKKAFEIRKWVSVSNHSGDTTLLKIVVKAICGTDGADLSTKEQMLRSLKRKLEEEQTEQKKKKLEEGKTNNENFLLILDDVWNEQSGNGADTYFRDQWDDLKLALKQCVARCRIIVTTRSINVARIMGTTVSPYHHLGVLSENDCWAIFEKCAFRSGGAQRSPALEKIGREIVKKCGGVPLVAKTLGALLSSKQTPNDWWSINDKIMINITSGDDSNIVRVLKLSYDHLSPPLRRCFSYCAIFPKGFHIYKERLIRMWIAQGFLPSSNGDDIEKVGNDYFDTLCGSCFFQDIQVNNRSGEIEACKMHDLMHDLAQSTCGKECLVVDSNANDISETYHLWVDGNGFDPEHLCRIHEENLPAMERLRTFVGVMVDFDLSKFKCLRVLILRNAETLPAAVGNLIHLRYLYIYSRSLQALPNSICQLYKLQFLDVQWCGKLKELPADLWKLINLRHLFVGYHTKMPKGFGRLKNLRKLPILVVGLWENGCEIEDLENLNHLSGDLKIGGLQNVRTVESAEKARLKEKKNVNSLKLFWNYGANDSVNYDEVLEAMQPPPRLSELSIELFPGGNLPKWLTNALIPPVLIKLRLSQCNGLTEIPALWRHLPCLQVLELSNCKRVKLLGGCDQKEQTTISQPSRLKRLVIDAMVALEEWGEDFPDVEELMVICCYKLRIRRTHFPVLEMLTLENCDDLEVTLTTSTRSLKEMDIACVRSVVVVEEEEESTSAAYNNLTSLTSLSIVGVPDFTTLPKGLLQNNKHLQNVKIHDCPRFQGFFAGHPVLRPSSSLKNIEITRCPSVTAVDLSGLTSLQSLKLEALPLLESPALLHMGGDFTLLKDLYLGSCSALTSLDVSRCGCLEKLEFFLCKNLKITISTPLPSLKILEVEDIHGLVIEEAVGNSNSLTQLCIEGVPEFITLPKWFLRNNKNLKEVTLVDCPKLQGFLHGDEEEAGRLQLTSPVKIIIENCPCVMSLDIRGWESLRELKLLNCPRVVKPSFQVLDLVSLPSLWSFEIGGGLLEEELDYFPFPTCPMPQLGTLKIGGWCNLKSLPHQLQHVPTTLYCLRITHFDGLTALPDWLGTLSSLKTLEISHCHNLTHFVPITIHNPFPSLIKLRLAHVCGTFVESAIKSLTSLVSLSVEGVSDLTTLPIGFLLNNEKLRNIELKSCPGFRDEDSLQLMTSLKELKIEDCQSVTSLGFMRGLASLEGLALLNCKGIVISSDEDLESSESLYSLVLGGFSEELDYFPFPTRPMQCLRELKIKGWSKLMSLPQQLQHLSNLRALTITNFDGLIALPDWIGKLSSLEDLNILHCKNLMHLPSKTDMQRLTSLESLQIMGCPHLTKGFMAGGEEWCKLSFQQLTGLYFE